jgi:tight adherence protein C
MDISISVTIAAVFITAALVAWSLATRVVEGPSQTRRRLNAIANAGAEYTAAGHTIFDGARTLKPRLIPVSPKNMGRLRRRLGNAGFHHPAATTYFVAAQVVLTAILGLLPLLLVGQSKGMLMAAFGAVLGYVAPGFYLDRRVSQRKLRIENGLPDALDLLIVSLEAGLALDQAILKTGEELAIAHPDVAEELRLINIECRAGKPRIEAFKNFAARTKVDDVRALVAMLVQTDRFGTSVAKALRTHAEVSRTKRRQRAEERSAKIGVKLVFPLVFCLFPAFYVVTLGPAIIKFIQAFGSGGFATGDPLP